MIHCLTRLEELHVTRYPLPEKLSIALQQYFFPHPPSCPVQYAQCTPQYSSTLPGKLYKQSHPQLSTPHKLQWKSFRWSQPKPSTPCKPQRVPDKPLVLVPDTLEQSEMLCSMKSIPFGSAASISPVILTPNTSLPATIIPVPAFRKCVRFGLTDIVSIQM